ncbi:MAG: hypothetical protein FWF24_06310 [Alphaproteobacteria bacterium]|nr:hypothetical protein [Alphaproteobacteria bacterium]
MIGVLCGLKSEAKIADRIPGVLVACSGAQALQAQKLVKQLADQGVRRLISFGLAGGLSPELQAGDLLLGVSVMATASGCWEADERWNKPLVGQLPDAFCVSFWGSDRTAFTAEEKNLVFRRTGCMAIDMESHIVARAAARYNIPFNIVRAVSDGATFSLPPAARVPLTKEGTIDRSGIWKSIKKQPLQIKDLVTLGLSTHRAMQALKRAVEVLRQIEAG